MKREEKFRRLLVRAAAAHAAAGDMDHPTIAAHAKLAKEIRKALRAHPQSVPTEEETLCRMARVKKSSPVFVVESQDDDASDWAPEGHSSKWGPYLNRIVGDKDEERRYLSAQGRPHVLVGKDWLAAWRARGSVYEEQKRETAGARVAF